MNININNKLTKFVMHKIQHYNHQKYWKRRKEVVDINSKKLKIIRMYYLYYIKKCDAYNNASMGTDLGKGAFFETPPLLPHHLNGIIVSHYARIGKNCTIFQQVTIAEGKEKKAAIIGDNCLIGAGAKIIGNVKIGNNVKIGANAVVVTDIPDDCTAVGVPAKIIKHEKK